MPPRWLLFYLLKGRFGPGLDPVWTTRFGPGETRFATGFLPGFNRVETGDFGENFWTKVGQKSSKNYRPKKSPVCILTHFRANFSKTPSPGPADLRNRPISIERRSPRNRRFRPIFGQIYVFAWWCTFRFPSRFCGRRAS